MSNKQKMQGFTLIELIVVIVILGILAGVAVPRFINQTGKARAAAIQGLAGNLNSAISLAQAAYLAEGNNTLTTISMNGTVVNVVATTGAPSVANLTGANGVLSSFSGFDSVIGTTNATFSISGAPSGCSVVYTQGTTALPPTVTFATSGC